MRNGKVNNKKLNDSRKVNNNNLNDNGKVNNKNLNYNWNCKNGKVKSKNLNCELKCKILEIYWRWNETIIESKKITLAGKDGSFSAKADSSKSFAHSNSNKSN